MKTAQSFFATRANVGHPHQEKTYQVLKKKQIPQRSALSQTHQACVNIFKEEHFLPSKQLKDTIERPIGGMQLFKKMQKFVAQKSSRRKNVSRINKSPTQKTISNRKISQRFQFNKNQAEQGVSQVIQLSPTKEIAEIGRPATAPLQDEQFKSHKAYQSQALKKSSSKFNTKTAGDSYSIVRPATCGGNRQTTKHDEWAAQQRKQYHDKNALLNQINYNKPLVQTYGQRYFEYMLRNRFQEDKKPKPFIYQLSSTPFTNTKVISRLKRYRPDIVEKDKMVLKGRKITFQN